MATPESNAVSSSKMSFWSHSKSAIIHLLLISLLIAYSVFLFQEEGNSLHVWFLIILCFALYITLTWFVAEMTKALREHEQADDISELTDSKEEDASAASSLRSNAGLVRRSITN